MKTTVLLDAADYQRLKKIAAAEGRSVAALVRSAVAAYLRSRTAVRCPASIGAGWSGDGTLAARAEELLWGSGGGTD